MSATWKTVRIFISYSHRGIGPEWKAKLLRALHVFEQQHLLDVWQDGKIRVSAFWDDDIKQAMANARIAVVLLTKDALDPRTPDDPNYILDTEFPILRERQRAGTLTVFPVVCEDCDWRARDWLRATQAPNESNPLAQLSEARQDHEFCKLATAIAEELSRISLAENSALRTPNSELKTYLDKFPLIRSPGLREEKLIGREQELALLDLAFAQPHTAIVSLVAWGGVGKTMLVQHWLQRLQREGWFGARRVYAWSFYSQGTKEDRQASEDTFLAHALEWFGVQCEPTLSPWDKGRLLADAVARERTLLILDGIEPLQYPPGPMGGQLRAPGVQSLLKQLVRKAAAQSQISNAKSEIFGGLCLVTTRAPLTDLADFQRREGSPWGSALRVDLGNLTDEAGAALLHHAGANRAGAAEIKPDGKELLAASRKVDGHALTLNLLGRFLARAHGGDIRRRDLVKFEEADRKEQGGTTFKMLAAFEKWFANEGDIESRALTVLRLLGLFDRPANAGCMSALRKPPIIPALTEALFTLKRDSNTGQTTEQPLSDKAWNDATYFLSDFGLLTIQADDDKGEKLLDCHPLIREHFVIQLRKLNANAWQDGNSRLYVHLTSVAKERPDTIDDIGLLYQAVAHGCKAGKYAESRDRIYQNRICRDAEAYSIKKLGAFSDDLACMANFFKKPWTQVHPPVTKVVRAWLLHNAAFRLRALGRITDAIQPMTKAQHLAEKAKDWHNAAIGAGNLAELEATTGNLRTAVRIATRAVKFSELDRDDLVSEFIKDELLLSGELSKKADVLHQMGVPTEARTLFIRAESIQARLHPEHPFLYSIFGFSFCDLLLATSERAAWWKIIGSDLHEMKLKTMLIDCDAILKRASNTLRIAETHLGILDVALDELTLSRLAIYRSILKMPLRKVAIPKSRHLAAAVIGLFRAGAQQYVPLGLLTRAWLRFLECDGNGARADLDEAWDIAERGPMRLHLADIHLHRARLFFREQPYPWKSPQADLDAAEKLINDCGYHRRDQELADAKRAILGTV